MRIARGTCVITLSRPCPYKYTPHHNHYLFVHSRTNPSATLALDDAGDEALRCRNLSNAIFTPTADIVFSAVTVGVLRRQVRAWKIKLLGLILNSV